MITEFMYHDTLFTIGDLYKKRYNTKEILRLKQIELITLWDGTQSRYMCKFHVVFSLLNDNRGEHSTHLLNDYVSVSPNELVELRIKLDNLLCSEAQRYKDMR